MEIRIGKWDIYGAVHKWFRIGYDKEVYADDMITFRNLHLGFISVYIDSYDYLDK